MIINLKNITNNLKIKNTSNIDDNTFLTKDILQVFFHINL